METPEPAPPASGDKDARRVTVVPGGLRLGSLFGAPIYVAPSWLIFLAWVTVAFAPLVDDSVEGIGNGRYAVSLAFGLFLGLSVLAHEIGHCALARAVDVPVQRVVLTWLAGHSAFEREPGSPGRMVAVAIAGPIVNIVIAAAAWGAGQALTPGTVAWVLAAGLTWTNALVGAYNLLPGLPLDGGQVLRAAVWAITRDPRAGVVGAAWAGRVLGAATAIVGLVLLSRPSGADRSSGVWALLVAAMIIFSSSAVLRQQTMRDRLPSLVARALARRAISVPADLPLSEAVRRAEEAGARGIVIADGYGRPTAVVSESAVAGVEPRRRPWVSVSAVARGVSPAQLVRADLGGQGLLDELRKAPATEYVLVEPDGALAGVLAASDIAARMRG